MKQVLIIDDEGDLVEMLVLRLQKSGFLVDVALDGDTGLKEAIFSTPDVILLDIAMPGMGGWDVCKKLRDHSKTKNVPVIIITAKQIKDVHTRAKEVGANKVLTKPFDEVELVKAITAVIQA